MVKDFKNILKLLWQADSENCNSPPELRAIKYVKSHYSSNGFLRIGTPRVTGLFNVPQDWLKSQNWELETNQPVLASDQP